MCFEAIGRLEPGQLVMSTSGDAENVAMWLTISVDSGGGSMRLMGFVPRGIVRHSAVDEIGRFDVHLVTRWAP